MHIDVWRPRQQTGLHSNSNSKIQASRPMVLWQAEELVVVFGGVLARTGARTNELAWMTTERMEWHLQARA